MKKLLLLCFLATLASLNCQRPDDCSNGVKDGDEVDIDCGGRCGECPNCLDGIQNYQELGVDCGSNCKPCKNTWEILPPNFQTFDSNWLMDFTSETNGLIVSFYGREVYTTKNGGETWEEGFLPPYQGTAEPYAQMVKLYMADDSLGFLVEKVEPAISAECFLYRTTDGGTTWQLVTKPIDMDVAF
ncbi:MAG: hypothetical protein IT258_02790, partial [Saprospiraceae bacterium]|nr:hypothetical protein [Saprospiraceae bacterium]